MHETAHLWTALAYLLIGAAMLGVAFTVWWTHPINRVFLFGRYLTPEGARVIMASWHLVALFGAFIFSCAIDHAMDWWVDNGHPEVRGMLTFFSIVEAVISWSAALVVLWLGAKALVRLWRHQ